MIHDALELIQQEREKRTGHLDLGNCGFSKPPAELFTLDWLETLNLSSYYFKFDEKSLLWERKVSANTGIENKVIIEYLDGIGQLKRLKSLYISADGASFGIANFEFIEQLPLLERLFINCTQLIDLRYFKNLHQLQTFSFRSKLTVRNFQVLGGLHNLQHLSVSCRDADNLHRLADLRNLKALDLHFSKETSFEFISELAGLESLELRHNKIEHINFLKNLKELRSLDLRFNLVANLEPLKDHQRLRSLMLTDNRVKDISPISHLIEKGVPLLWERFIPNTICTEGNPITNPPEEIIRQGNAAILRYFDRLKQGIDHLYEAKVIVLGDQGAGKTSLRLKLMDINNPLPREEESTSGIDIESLKFQLTNPRGRDFSMHVWDFGGQEIYHNTHQFFLTKRSVYVLVVNNRTDKEKLDWWLQLVELLGGNSPLLIFHNEMDNRIGNIDYVSLAARYNSFLKAEHICNLKLLPTVQSQCDRFQHFRDALQLQLKELPHIGEPLPSQWVTIREEINRTAQLRDWIRVDEFYAICGKHRVNERISQDDLSQYFHDLGVFLHFQTTNRPSLLSKIVILNKEWATKAVYKVLESTLVEKEKMGRFSFNDLGTIWAESPFLEKREELLELMMRFELCYPIEDTDEYIAPQLLPAKRPPYLWVYGQNLILKYNYDFMPKGIITRLIVRLHRYIAENQQLVWKEGAVFQYNKNTRAEVVEAYGKREIGIRVSGSQQRDLLAIIVKSLDELNSSFSFNEKTQVRKLVPCICDTCKDLELPHFYNENVLQVRLENSKLTIECDNPPFLTIQIPLLLQSFVITGNKTVIIAQIEELVGLSEIEKALTLLKDNFERHEVTLLRQRFHQNKNLFNNGVLSPEKFRLQLNQIAKSILELLPSLAH